jgi:hypothetical protein
VGGEFVLFPAAIFGPVGSVGVELIGVPLLTADE